MSYAKNDIVQAKTKSGEMTGTVRDRFIQNTELEYSGETLTADASAENPVYLVELDNGRMELMAEDALTIKTPHQERS